MITAERLAKSYGAIRALDEVSFEISKGQVVGFVGPNGAGKTTVLNLLGGQLLPTAGEIRFDGKPLRASKPSDRARAGIGRSFQLTSIIPGFTCFENVVLAVQAQRGLFGLLRLHSRKEDVAHATDQSSATCLLSSSRTSFTVSR